MIRCWDDQVRDTCGTRNTNTHTHFSGETWRKYPVGRPRWRWDDNIKMDCKQDWTM